MSRRCTCTLVSRGHLAHIGGVFVKKKSMRRFNSLALFECLHRLLERSRKEAVTKKQYRGMGQPILAWQN